MIRRELLPEESRRDAKVRQMDKSSIARIDRLGARLAGVVIFILISYRFEVVADLAHHIAFDVLLLDVVDDKQVEWLQVQVHDALGVDLVKTQKQVSCNDLDISQIERLASINKVLKQVGRARGHLELLVSLYLLQDAIN